MKQKQCNKCRKLKPLSQFYKHPATKDKYCYICKNCQKIYSRNYITLHKKTEKYKNTKREYSKKWRKENVMKARMHSRKANKKYAALNPEKIKENIQKYKKANAEKIRLYRKTYNKAWRQTPKGKLSEKKKEQAKRIQLNNCVINDLTSNQIQILLTKAKRCAICNKVFNKKRKKTLDHIVPLARGGNNTWLNIQVTCMSCNCRKSVKDYTEFNGGQILMFV